MAKFADFGDHPWAFDEARDAGYHRAFGDRAVDGDTLDLIVDPGYRLRPKIRVRIKNLDTAEMYGVDKDSEEYQVGKAAQEAAAELIEGKPLLVRASNDTGKYGRWMAEVRVEIGPKGNDGATFREIMIEGGYDED